MEAIVVCMYGQMWTKRDKNRTQNRTHFFYSFDYRIEARFISKNISIDGAILGGFRRVI